MKITQLLEGSVAGDPGITQNSQQAPRFGRNPTTLEQVANVPNVGYKSGRDPKVLEKKVEETTAGCVASVAQPLFKQSRTTKESSISTGIKSSKKYSNSPVTEDELSEEQLLAKQLRHELFKKSKLRDIGKPIKKSDILLKKELEQGVAEGHADQQRKIFKKNGKPVGEVGIDRESSPGVGQWYMTCYGVVSYGGYDSYEEAVEELKHCLKQKQGLAEAIPYALSAANANAEYERTKTFVPRGYKGRVDLDVGGHDEYTEVMHTLQHAAKQAGQHVECGRSGNEMSVFSKTMGTDELDAFIDDTLEQGVAEGTNDTIYPGAEVIKSKNGKPLGEIYQDKSGWGCFHYKADNGADCIDSREEALFWLKELNDEYRQDRSLREQGVAEGDVAKLAGITALGIGAGLGANYLDQQSPKVEFDGKNGQVVKAYLEPAYSNRIPDNAMTIKGKDGKTYHVWSTAGKGMNSKSYHAAPAEKAKQSGVAEGNLNELSPKTLGSYINKANKDVGTLGYGLGDIKARPGKYKDSPDVVKSVQHSFNNRIKGVEKAANRLTKQQGVAEGELDEAHHGGLLDHNKGQFASVIFQSEWDTDPQIDYYDNLDDAKFDTENASAHHGSVYAWNGARWVRKMSATERNGGGSGYGSWSEGVAEGQDERKQNALWAQITDYEKRAKATTNDTKKQHYMKMADQLRGQLKTSDNVEEGPEQDYNVKQIYDKHDRDVEDFGIVGQGEHWAGINRAKQRRREKDEEQKKKQGVSEMSAGSVATVVNPTPKNKAKVGTLFGGTYNQKSKKA